MPSWSATDSNRPSASSFLLAFIRWFPALIGPNPVAVCAMHAALVLPGPGDGIEHERSVRGPAVVRRLAADHIMRRRVQKLRKQGFERFGIFAMDQPVSFEGAGDHGLIDLGLDLGGALNSPGEWRRAEAPGKFIWAAVLERLRLPAGGIDPVGEDHLVGGVDAVEAIEFDADVIGHVPITPTARTPSGEGGSRYEPAGRHALERAKGAGDFQQIGLLHRRDDVDGFK